MPSLPPNRWNEIEQLFLRAVEVPASAREQFLEDACRGDETLRSEVQSLLACDSPADPLVQVPVLAAEDDSQEGRRIGPYRIVRLLGSGGMGSVYLAVRDDHYQKEVAIKLLKRGMDTDFMLSRFRQERQILANLEHPFIARLLDGGATDDGLPYFVMEYVDGLPITRHCAGLGLAERLRLFRMVCEAVQYAHQSLVVHRDLKPGNILITREGIPKLLDFGIAKLVSADSDLTQRELRMMTPDYASPEQAMGRPIGTASDIYALGTVLYELLAGEKAHRFSSDAPSDIERTICEIDPEKPSLAARGDAKRSRELAGDLDNIILTAMRKDPPRRYASAAEFSDDIRRHQEGRPVTAREDTLFYRSGKFVRRNKLAVAAAVLIASSLIGGMAAANFQARRAERRFQLVRQLANSMLFDLHDQIERLPGTTAVQASMIQTVVQYLDSLARDSGSDPTLDFEIATAYFRVAEVEGRSGRSNLGQTTTALGHYRKALEIYERLAKSANSRDKVIGPLINAHLTLHMVTGSTGDSEASRLHLEKAAAIAAETFSRGSPEVSFGTQIFLYERLSGAAMLRGDDSATQEHARKMVEISEKQAAKDSSSASLGSLRSSYLGLADALKHSGDFNAARDYFEKALRVGERLMARPDATYNERYSMASIYHVYGDMLGATDDPNMGDPEGALAQFRKAEAISTQLAAADPQDVNARRNLAGAYTRIGLILLSRNPAEALQYYRRALAISEEIGSKDPKNIQHRSSIAFALLGVGNALQILGRNEEAVQTLSRQVEIQKFIESVAPGQTSFLRTTSRAYMIMGDALAASGNAAGALAAYREGLAAAERQLQRAPSSINLQMDRAEIWEALGRYYLSRRARTEARAWFEKSLNLWQDWTNRKVVASYAARRESQTVSYIASCDRP